MKTKLCTKCKKTKIHTTMNKSGLCNLCAVKKWKREHRADIRAYNKTPKPTAYYRGYYDENKGRIKAYAKNRYENNKEKRNNQNKEYRKQRYKEDEAYRNRVKLGSSLNMVIRTYIKKGKIANPMKKFCIDWEGIIRKLTPIPKDRERYNVDHIIPLYKFDLANWEQIQLAFAPENHRWLLIKDNQGRSKLKRKVQTKSLS